MLQAERPAAITKWSCNRCLSSPDSTPPQTDGPRTIWQTETAADAANERVRQMRHIYASPRFSPIAFAARSLSSWFSRTVFKW